MLFISLLIAATLAIAGAAEYFSIYGLANTFGGVFWSVVIMGASLGAGKLVAVSYLYRYWTKTNIWLKCYLMAGVLALMALTSMGVFGYLSTGYQQDILPLQQKQQQIQLLDEEKTRNIARKKQIDDLMANATTVTRVNRADGSIDPNATRALRETTRSRDTMFRQYQLEQGTITKRIGDLDAQLLQLKQDVIKVEAHTGPIIYIAKAFSLPTDDATKYLIFMIIFSFDPMAVALTLAVNIALRLRREEKSFVPPPHLIVVEPVPEETAKTAAEPSPSSQPEAHRADLPPEEIHLLSDMTLSVPIPLSEETPAPALVGRAAPTLEIPTPEIEPMRQTYTPTNQLDMSQAKIAQLVNHYRFLRGKSDSGQVLSKEETWELNGIENVLRNNGYGMYLS